MRIVDSIPHPSMTISIFQMNQKYLVKFEAGPMEQIFKFDTDEISSIEQLKKRITAEFIETTYLRFKEMYLSFRTV
ncbi:MAG: hypothetical protein JSU07_00780 [Bacteroidetes bacterium]|nr:hypothetical protein [Bacteroidota bacterium]